MFEYEVVRAQVPRGEFEYSEFQVQREFEYKIRHSHGIALSTNIFINKSAYIPNNYS